MSPRLPFKTCHLTCFHRHSSKHHLGCYPHLILSYRTWEICQGCVFENPRCMTMFTGKRQKCCMYDSPPSRIKFNNIQTRRQSVSYWSNYVVSKTFTSDCHWQVLCAECPTVNRTRALLQQHIPSVWIDNLTGIDTFMVLQSC
jgi:hypothetical protein